jgi:hypothetical protein
VENKGVVSVQDVRTIHSESRDEVADQAEREARGFAKSMDGHVCGLGLASKLTGMTGAIDGGLVAFGLLLARQVYGEALHSS